MGRDGQVGKVGISPDLAAAIDRFANAVTAEPICRPGPEWFTIREFVSRMAERGMSMCMVTARERMQKAVADGQAEMHPPYGRRGREAYYRLLPSSEGK
jgi:hypothetical protein